ncbi:MAG: hypothetical protein ACRDTX_06395 [Pseudonocardiaceae bacterium]
MGGAALEQRVERAAEAALAEKSYVSAIDVFLGLGWLAPTHLDEWRQGRVQCLERVAQASLPKLSTAMRVVRGETVRELSCAYRACPAPVIVTLLSPGGKPTYFATSVGGRVSRLLRPGRPHHHATPVRGHRPPGALHR